MENPDLKFILPIHPNPNVLRYQYLLPAVKVINPLKHDELINLLLRVKLVITDSGGIQEECSFFNKTALVCRKITERPESVGITSYLVPTYDTLAATFTEHINEVPLPLSIQSPYGDGKSSQKICDIFETLA